MGRSGFAFSTQSRSRRGPDVTVLDGPALPATSSGKPLPFQVGRIAYPSDAAKPISAHQSISPTLQRTFCLCVFVARRTRVI
jgi:hypothetical protein